MAYTPINPGVPALFVIYLILITFGIFITSIMFKKWKERESKLPLILGMAFICLIGALGFLAAGLLETLITGYFKEIYRTTFPLAYVGVIVGDVILFKFTNELTDNSGNALYIVIIIGIILSIMLILPWNWWGFPAEEYEDKFSIRIYSTLFFALYSITIYLIIIIISLKARRMAEKKKARLGFLLFACSVFCMVIFFVFNIIENILIVVFDHPGYSIWVYLGWIFALLFIILAYLSLVMPDFLVKRLNL